MSDNEKDNKGNLTFDMKEPEESDHDSMNDDHDCAKCSNISCKCQLILENLKESTELAMQINHNQLVVILTTIVLSLTNLSNDTTSLNKILEACQETYKSMNPKEMGISIN